MPLRLSLRELEVFVAVADEGTVTAAASAVALTQSAASQALAALEEGLGARLFDRIGRRLLLNAQGRRLLPPARALLSNALALQDLLGDPEAVHLRLGASTTIGNYLLPPLLALWRQRHPQARIDLLVANTADVVEAVASLQVDAGYIEGPSHHPDLVIEPWRQDRLVLVAAAGHALSRRRVTLQQLTQAPWVLREPGSGTREEVERLLLPHLGHFADVRSMGQSEAIRGLVVAGGGVSCLSEHVVADAMKQGQLVELRTPLPALHRTLFRVRHRLRADSPALQRFEALGRPAASPASGRQASATDRTHP